MAQPRGSKTEVKKEGGMTEVRVSAGAYGGRQQMDQHGWESTEEWRRRQAGEGLRCMRLPDHYEVVDDCVCSVAVCRPE